MTPQEAEKKTLSDINRQIESIMETLKKQETAPFTDAVILLNLASVMQSIVGVVNFKMEAAADSVMISANPALKVKCDHLLSTLKEMQSTIDNTHQQCDTLSESFMGFAEACLGGPFFVREEQQKKGEADDHKIIAFQ